MTTPSKIALFVLPLFALNLAPLQAQEKPKSDESELSQRVLDALKSGQPKAGEKPAAPAPTPPAGAKPEKKLPGFSDVAPTPAPKPVEPAKTPEPVKPAPRIIVLPPSDSLKPAPGTSIKDPAPTAGEKPKTYTVRSGDTLGSIALSVYGDEGKWTALSKANPTVDPVRLKIGQVLKLPDLAVQHKEREKELDDVKTELTKGDGSVKIVQVEPGDNLSKISQRVYGRASKWRTLFEANRDQLPSPDDLEVGMKLKVPALPGEKPSEKPAPAKPVTENPAAGSIKPSPENKPLVPPPAPGTPSRLPAPAGPAEPAPVNRDGTKG